MASIILLGESISVVVLHHFIKLQPELQNRNLTFTVRGSAMKFTLYCNMTFDVRVQQVQVRSKDKTRGLPVRSYPSRHDPVATHVNRPQLPRCLRQLVPSAAGRKSHSDRGDKRQRVASFLSPSG